MRNAGRGSTHNKRIGFFLALAALLGCDKTPEIRGFQARNSSETIAHVSPTPVDAIAPTWTLHDEYNYSIHLASTLGVEGQDPMVAFDLASGLAVGVVALPQADSAQLYCRFTSPRFTSTAGGADKQFDRLASELKQGFFVTITAGKLAEIRVLFLPRNPAPTTRS